MIKVGQMLVSFQYLNGGTFRMCNFIVPEHIIKCLSWIIYYEVAQSDSSKVKIIAISC